MSFLRGTIRLKSPNTSREAWSWKLEADNHDEVLSKLKLPHCNCFDSRPSRQNNHRAQAAIELVKVLIDTLENRSTGILRSPHQQRTQNLLYGEENLQHERSKMRNVMSSLAILAAVLCIASADAFSRAFHSSGIFKSMRTTMSALSTSSKYTSKEAESFSNDIQRVISLGPVPLDERQFLINGWRWHTASALRDLQRYSDVLEKIEALCDTNDFVGESSQEDFKKRIVSCYNYVCDYNLKALMKIESELFFPWLQRLLPAAALPLMIEIVQDQDNVKALSSQVGSLCKSLSGTSNDLNLIKKIGTKVREIKRNYLKIQSVQETIFVPYITAYIPKKEQERFNRGVISNLGFIRAQVHLCGMIEAIKDQPGEMSLLRSQIPSIAQATLPVWKKRVYDPKTACLNSATW